MKERPILFSGPMVRAITEGRKKQTRRLIPNDWWRCLDPDDKEDVAKAIPQCPYGVAGDRLWVRETFGFHAYGDETDWAPRRSRIGEGFRDRWDLAYRADWGPLQEGCLWRPSIFMPRWASRLTLAITEVKVQRLQEISEADARAEGVRELPLQEGQPGAWWTADASAGAPLHGRDPVAAFCKLWDSLNYRRAPWDSDPWVWVVTFDLVRKADEMGAPERKAG